MTALLLSAAAKATRTLSQVNVRGEGLLAHGAQAVSAPLSAGFALALGFLYGPAVYVLFVVTPDLAEVPAGKWIVGAGCPSADRVDSPLAVAASQLPVFGEL